MQLLAAILCVILAIIGIKSLHIFAISNGLAGHLERQISNISTPAGKKLSTLTTGGRFPKVDLQINAVASFLLLFCENLTQPDVNIVGFSFAASWGSSWLLIVLESFREYSQSRMMSWIAIPGILIFNQSHAVFTSLYLAIRLVVATPATTATSLMVHTIHLRAILWSFSLGYILPMFVMAMPGLSAFGLNTKHVVASLYQQWNLYISLFHFILVSWWTRTSTMDRTKDEDPGHLLSNLRPVYAFAFILAVTSVWIPILLSFLAHILKKIRRSPAFSYESFQLANLFLPPSPWSRVKCNNALEGGKWLLQWDGMIGGLSTAIWAISLYTEARNVMEPQEVMESFYGRLIWYMLLGGPIGVATGVLWERDNLVLQQL